MRALFVIVLMLFCASGFSQDNQRKDYLESFSTEKLKHVKLMGELFTGNQKEFYEKNQITSVELLGTIDGKDVRSLGKNDTLTVDQRTILKKATPGSRIGFEVKWYDLKDQYQTPQYFSFLFNVIE